MYPAVWIFLKDAVSIGNRLSEPFEHLFHCPGIAHLKIDNLSIFAKISFYWHERRCYPFFVLSSAKDSPLAASARRSRSSAFGPMPCNCLTSASLTFVN